MPSEEAILFNQVKCHLRVKVNTVILLPGCWQTPGTPSEYRGMLWGVSPETPVEQSDLAMDSFQKHH